MTVAEIDWGDRPDWRERLEAARRPSTVDQVAFDAEWCGLWTQARAAGRTHRSAIRSAYLRTEARKGQRPANEETT